MASASQPEPQAQCYTAGQQPSPVVVVQQRPQTRVIVQRPTPQEDNKSGFLRAAALASQVTFVLLSFLYLYMLIHGASRDDEKVGQEFEDAFWDDRGKETAGSLSWLWYLSAAYRSGEHGLGKGNAGTLAELLGIRIGNGMLSTSVVHVVLLFVIAIALNIARCTPIFRVSTRKSVSLMVFLGLIVAAMVAVLSLTLYRIVDISKKVAEVNEKVGEGNDLMEQLLQAAPQVQQMLSQLQQKLPELQLLLPHLQQMLPQLLQDKQFPANLREKLPQLLQQLPANLQPVLQQLLQELPNWQEKLSQLRLQALPANAREGLAQFLRDLPADFADKLPQLLQRLSAFLKHQLPELLKPFPELTTGPLWLVDVWALVAPLVCMPLLIVGWFKLRTGESEYEKAEYGRLYDSDAQDV